MAFSAAHCNSCFLAVHWTIRAHTEQILVCLQARASAARSKCALLAAHSPRMSRMWAHKLPPRLHEEPQLATLYVSRSCAAQTVGRISKAALTASVLAASRATHTEKGQSCQARQVRIT